MLRLRIFPVGLFGSSSTTTTWRGYLYAATRSFVHALSSSGSSAAPGTRHHDRGDVLAEHLVRHADDGRFEDRRVLVQHLLDLARVDVVAAADDHLLLAIDEEQVAVLVEVAEITGGEPALAVDRGRRRVRVVPVAADDRRSAELHLTHAPLVRIRDANLRAPDGCPTEPGLPRRPVAKVVASPLISVRP